MAKIGESFFNDLHTLSQETKTRLCVGIDPHLGLMPENFQSLKTSTIITKFCEPFTFKLLEVAKETCRVVKFQSAFYEQFGADGVELLNESIKKAKKKNILTILDCKRSDIESTMSAYGSFAFNKMAADAMTVVPYFAGDTLSALRTFLNSGKGLYIVLISSNPSGDVLKKVGGGKFFENFFEYLETVRESHFKYDFGYVIGATKLNGLEADFLNQLSRKNLLCPGIGAQGFKSSDFQSLFQKDKSASVKLAPVSRGLYQQAIKLKNSSIDWSFFQKTVLKTTKEYAQNLGVF